ncbi:MAG TPA: TAXI family TRAP transporter solute-binding subunit [Vicinamibacterales bacterium]|nr:TAXI family TRAP transporter solute-binding subunit [Vicinamibacterales bacterium]
MSVQGRHRDPRLRFRMEPAGVMSWTGAVSLILSAILSAGACRRAPDPPAGKPALRVATAFAPFSTRLTEEYRRTMPDLDIQEHPSVSSASVLSDIQEGKLDFGVALADDAYRAYFGEDTASTRPDSAVRAISLLQPLPTYLLARTGSGVHRIADLEGKVVAVGPQNSSVWKLGTLVLKAFGVQPVTIRAMNSRELAVQGLKDGSLDAIMLPGYVYPEALTEALLREGGAYLLPIDGPPVEKLRRESPFVRVVMIPRDIYPGQNSIVPTVGIDLLIVCRRDLDERLAYRLAEQLFNVFPRLARVEANMRFLNVEDAPATPIPLHAGAGRYFRERELSR